MWPWRGSPAGPEISLVSLTVRSVTQKAALLCPRPGRDLTGPPSQGVFVSIVTHLFNTESEKRITSIPDLCCYEELFLRVEFTFFKNFLKVS